MCAGTEPILSITNTNKRKEEEYLKEDMCNLKNIYISIFTRLFSCILLEKYYVVFLLTYC